MNKKHLILSVLILVSAIVVARVQAIYSLVSGQESSESVTMAVPENLQPGDEFMLSIALNNINEYTAFKMDVVAPQGVTFVQEMNEDNELNYVCNLNADRKKSDHQVSYNYFPESNTLRLACFSSTNKTFKGTEGELIKVKMRVSEDVPEKCFLNLSDVAFTDTDGKDYPFANATLKLDFQAPLPASADFKPGKMYYLLNADSRKYFCAGNSWNTQASVGSSPLLVKFTQYELEDGVYLLNDFFRNSWMQVFFDSEETMFVDRNSQANYGFNIVKVGDYYRLQAASSTTINPNYNATAYPNMYVGLDVSSNMENTALSPFLSEGEGHYIDWILVNPDNTSVSEWISTNHNAGSSSSYTWLFDRDIVTMLNFRWSVSSESGCDWLRITLDGQQIVEASGEQNGNIEKYLEPGGHILVATYSKDGSVDNGSDQAIVSNLQIGTIDEIIENYLQGMEATAANNSFVDHKLLEEATAYAAKIRAGDYDQALALKVIDQIIEYTERLGYLHLDINVAVPGSMGDSILTKVENFVDVQSLRLSGKLNNTDISNLKNRLTQLCALDMANLDWTIIPNDQFREKSSLKFVVLPESVESIGNNAFYNCRSLKDMIFPSTLKTIGQYAFYQTYGFNEVVLPEGLVTMNNHAFYNSHLTSVTFPSTLKTISESCFSECDYLRQVNFNAQTEIDNYAFYSCDVLNNIVFPATLTSIGYESFMYNRSLNRIEFNEGLTSIGDYSFYDCDALVSITLPSTLLTFNGYDAFRECNNLTRVTCRSIVPPYCNNNCILSWEGRDLYVPMLSVNAYKQTNGWDKFNIHGIDIMPASIVVNCEYNLNWPESITMDYKPDVYIYRNSGIYGALSVNGNSTLSAANFRMIWDTNEARNNSYYENNTYTHNRKTYGSLVNNAHVRADNVTIELWTRKNAWDFISLPFDIKVSDIRLAYDVPFVIRKYDGQKRAEGLTSETWVNMTADSTLHAGQGYIWRSANGENRNYNGFYLDAMQTVNKNNIFANDHVEVPLNYYESEFEHNRSWNLIGNPYPCFYDIRAMQTTAPIIVWDTYQQNYRAYSPADDSYILNPGQAFFVQRPVNEEVITFLKEGRQTNLTVRDMEYTNGSRMEVAGAKRNVFNLILTSGEQGDRTRFVINPQAKMEYEAARDATKFMSLEQTAVQLYTIEDGVNFAINERPLSNGMIYLGMQIAEERIYTIKLDTKSENEVYLMDKLTGMEIRLDGNAEGYTFTSQAGIFKNRFTIRLGQGETTGISEMTVSKNGHEESIFDLQGRRISKPEKGIYVKNGKKSVVK